MSSRGQYLLRISGRTKPNQNEKLLDGLKGDLEGIFGKQPGGGVAAFANNPGDGWPAGFVLKGYSVCQWHLSPLYQDKPYAPKHDDDKKNPKWLKYPDESTIDFIAEVHHTLTGPLYFNRHVMIDEVRWFYHHREYRWHLELVDLLEKLNAKYASILLERVWFRDWKWYCGNGGC